MVKREQLEGRCRTRKSKEERADEIRHSDSENKFDSTIRDFVASVADEHSSGDDADEQVSPASRMGEYPRQVASPVLQNEDQSDDSEHLQADQHVLGQPLANQGPAERVTDARRKKEIYKGPNESGKKLAVETVFDGAEGEDAPRKYAERQRDGLGLSMARFSKGLS